MRITILVAAAIATFGVAAVAGAAAPDAVTTVQPNATSLSPAALAVVARWRAAVAAEEKRTAVRSPSALADDLKRRVAIEQAARKLLPDWTSTGLSASDREAANKAIWDELGRIDAENTAYLKTVLPADGWFRHSRDGAQVAREAWLIVQHSPDRAFQRRVLELMAPLVAAGDADGSKYALLYDRVALHGGKRQRYGSQIVCTNGRFEPSPVEDPVRLDALRASVGLEPIAAYLRSWDGKTC